MKECVGQPGGTLEVSCYMTPEKVRSIEGIEDGIEGLTIKIDSDTSKKCPEGCVLITFVGEKETFWPSVWKAVNDRLAQG